MSLRSKKKSIRARENKVKKIDARQIILIKYSRNGLKKFIQEESFRKKKNHAARKFPPSP